MVVVYPSGITRQKKRLPKHDWPLSYLSDTTLITADLLRLSSYITQSGDERIMTGYTKS